MHYVLVAAGAASALALSTASAQDNSALYVGGGYTLFSADEVDFNAASVKGGVNLTPYLGVEAEAAFGLGEEEYEGVDFSLNYAIAGFATARYPFTDQLTGFARLGYSTLELEGNLEGESASASDEAIAYGIGGTFTVAGPHQIRADYTRYDFDDGDADAFGIGYQFKF